MKVAARLDPTEYPLLRLHRNHFSGSTPDGELYVKTPLL
jgi:hypothetical protein